MSLLSDYEEILELVSDYYKFATPKLLRMINPIVYVKVVRAISKFSNSNSKGNWAERRAENAKMYGESLYTESERNSDFYQVFTTPYPIHELSMLIKNKYPTIDFVKIIKISDIDEGRSMLSFGPLKFLGAVSLIISLFTAIAPGDFLNEEFKRSAFGIMIAFIMYFSFYFGTVAFAMHKYRLNKKRTKDVLTYCVESENMNN